MPRVQQATSLAVSPQTAQRFYTRRAPSPARDLPLGPEMLDVLPEPMRDVVRRLVRGRRVRAYLVRSAEVLTIDVRNVGTRRSPRPVGSGARQ